MKHVLILCLLVTICFFTPTQAAAQAIPDSVTLQGQYQDLLRKSRTQYYYKLVNPDRLSRIWRNAMDSLTAERKKVRQLKSVTEDQNSRLDSQASSLSAQQKTLQASRNRVDEISFLGFPFKKPVYNMVMWGMVLVLAIAFTVVFLKLTGYRREARRRIEQADEIAREFQAFKSKAGEKEKKLARELQDERNKLDELMKR